MKPIEVRTTDNNIFSEILDECFEKRNTKESIKYKTSKEINDAQKQADICSKCRDNSFCDKCFLTRNKSKEGIKI